MKKNWSLIAGALAVLLLLYFLSSSGKKPPIIPADAVHTGLATNESCAPCHAPGKQSPLKETHPPKEQCVVCHKAEAR
jgi:hypothetical protein